MDHIGCYSHAYEAFLIAVRKNERDHPEKYKERNERFKKEFGIEIPPLPEQYAHENTSLMMVDFALANLGKLSDFLYEKCLCLCTDRSFVNLLTRLGD